MPLINIPNEMKIVSNICEKTLKNGMKVDVYLVKTNHQYEAALFVEDRYKPGPPTPRPTDPPTEYAAYWMGVRPSVGFTQEEGDNILSEVKFQNLLNHCHFTDKWGTVDI